MELNEKTLTKEYMYRGKVVNMRRDKAELPDGQIVDREVVEHPGGVAIALEGDDGKFFLVKQWRYAQEKVLMEFPAGKKEKGEDPLDTAKREIVEETGYEGNDFVFLGEMVPTGAYDSEVISMYYAKQGAYRGQHFDDDENLQLCRMDLDELTEEIINGKIPDGKTMAMVLLIKEMKKRRK